MEATGIAVAIVMGLAVAASGCSGSHGSPIAGGGAEAGAEDSGSPAIGDTGHGMSSAPDSSEGTDAPNAPNAPKDAGAAVDSTSTPVDSGPPPPPVLPDADVEDGGGSSGSAGGNATSLPCGDVACAIPENTCCVSLSVNPPPEATFACVGGLCINSSFAQGGGIGLQCAGTANCAAGTICCMSDDGNGIITSACATPANCTDPNLQAQLCDIKAANAGCVEDDAGTCSSFNIGNWGLPTGYATCGGIPH